MSETKAVSFKMPLATWLAIKSAADGHGVDVTSIVNWLIAESLPALARMEARRKAATNMAVVEGLADAVEEAMRQIATEEGDEVMASSRRAILARLTEAA